MNGINRRALLTGILLWASSVGIGPVTILGDDNTELLARSSVDRATITVGDRIRYRIELIYPHGTEIQAPGFGVHLGEFEVKDYSVEEPKKAKDGKTHAVYEYIISTFTTGQYAIPPVAIGYKTPGGVASQIQTDKIDIMVESVKPSESGDIKDIKDTVEIEGGLDWWAYVLVGLVAAGAIVTGLYYWSKRKKMLLTAVLAKPPYDAAVEELRALLSSDLLSRGRTREFHFRISEIIRKYIGGRYDFNAPDLTTDELVQRLGEMDFEREVRAILGEFLRQCDLVKFADHPSTEAETANVIDTAGRILEKTKPIAPTVSTNAVAVGEEKTDAAVSRS